MDENQSVSLDTEIEKDNQENISKFSLKNINRQNIVSEENALDQIMLLVDRYNIDVDSMAEEKAAAMNETLTYLQKAVMSGGLSVEEKDGELMTTLYIRHKSEDGNFDKLVFREMRNKDHVAASGKNAGDSQYKKMQLIMASMCVTQNGQHAIQQLRASDASTVEYLSLLFL